MVILLIASAQSPNGSDVKHHAPGERVAGARVLRRGQTMPRGKRWFSQGAVVHV
jgi:hypothetical protein